MTLTFDLLTLKVMSESRVTWAISMPILLFMGLSVLDLGPMYATDGRQTKTLLPALGFSVLDLGPMYATDRQTSDRQTDR